MDTISLINRINEQNYSKTCRYKCVRCNLIFNEVDLLKDHYFDKHINVISTTNAKGKKRKNNVIKLNSTGNAKRVSKRKLKHAKLSDSSLNLNDADDEYNEIENSKSPENTNVTCFRTNSSITIKRRKLEVTSPASTETTPESDIDKRLAELTEEEMKKFNLENIDETELVNEIGDGTYNKRRELLAGRIAWVEWKHIMWPALIVKVTSRTATSSTSSLKIHIKFYEMMRKLGNVFKVDPSKVELFYKCKEHEHYKVLGAINQGQRKEFYVSYTNALKDYIECKEASIPTIKQEEVDAEIKEEINPLTQPKDKKFLVFGKQYTIEEVQEFASKSYSNEQIEENKIREDSSKNLVETILSEDCNVSVAF